MTDATMHMLKTVTITSSTTHSGSWILLTNVNSRPMKTRMKQTPYFSNSKHFTRSSTARITLAKYFIPGCVGRGLDLDLRARPAEVPAATGNLGIENLEFCSFGSGSKKLGEGLGYSRSTVSGTWAETESFHIDFSRSRQPFTVKTHESGLCCGM